ncbi:hypothetical protein [Saccharibacillus endophyticus]|uniref:Uncharacterized protein n=1 Tax=Saccharibacillus endophyticus TaxID=2060666 RepID=A0ABQ1ZRS0_9BACL|nr:hypothetical protein [Saccharibacillus endophyticus]GGH77270.1 hypothetical protein GCM10007362_20770 [Saccharibacillus endophyticus]
MFVDDYLDLYNYAKSIGDAEWQASLTALLAEQLASPAPSAEEAKLAALWERFDQINEELKDLFLKMRTHSDSAYSGRWEERVWELKLERIVVSQNIRFRHVGV